MSSLQIDTLAYRSRLRQLPPEHKLLFAIALLLITYVAQVPSTARDRRLD